MKSINRNHCSGQIVIIFALSLVVLIGMVGLALDSGMAYGVKAKLSSAVDAAAIAGGRALGTGANDAERIANAQKAAQKFFYGNFPPNYLGVTTPTLDPVAAQHDPKGYWKVTVTASAVMPTNLLRVLNFNQYTVHALGESIHRDLDMILVIDNSLSLTTSTNVFPLVQSAAINFIGHFIPSTDRVGLVSFGYGAVLNVPINKTASRGFNKDAVKNAIDGMSAIGSTASAEGMRQALNEINAVPIQWRSSLRVIVFFSDGAPNTIPASFTRTSGNPNPITGDLFSGINTTATPNSVYSYNQIKDQLTGPNPPNPPLPNANIATLPNNSGTTLTITDTGGTVSASSILLAGQRALIGTTNNECNVNKAARNMVENVANTARNWVELSTNQNQPIAIYSLGLGDFLFKKQEITNCGYGSNENGENILKRLANTKDSDTYQAANPTTGAPPTGIYCYADTTANPGALDSCFSAIASEILRLSR